MSTTAPRRLSADTLKLIRPGVVRPGYDRTRLRPGIVHLGLGAFVRGHLATYTDDMLALEIGDWGIIGVSLKRPDQRDRLEPQDGLYATLEREGEALRTRIIGCLSAVLVAPESPEAVIAAMADPASKIVSLTVTEKGYCHDPATGALDVGHPDIAHDLVHGAKPRSAIGLIVAALARRRDAGAAPFTVLCCDNLPHNGDLVAGLVRDFAARIDPALANWIATHGSFPATMVDRIVPATTDADLQSALNSTGLLDAAPVCHEPFRQWVIEDRFVAGARPPWERVGAQLVQDVAPYEHMKLRLLNGAHSALAYLGYLSGHQTIADAVADPVLAHYVKRLWTDEIIPVVPAPPDVNLEDYAAQLFARFANTAIRHRTWQIAMDGSQKLPQRLLATIRERLARDLPIPGLALAVAAWIRYVGGIDERGEAIDVRDPLAEQLRTALDHAGDDPVARAHSAIATRAVFGNDLPQSASFVSAVAGAFSSLHQLGAIRAVAALTR